MIRSANISAVVLCLNEAGNLGRCLNSLKWCSDLLVVDSGSNDGSQDLASKLGARVIEHRQQGRFLITEQRNWVLEHGGLESEWVLFLDADEDKVVEGLVEATEPLAERENIQLVVIEDADHFFRDFHAEDAADAIEEFMDQ